MEMALTKLGNCLEIEDAKMVPMSCQAPIRYQWFQRTSLSIGVAPPSVTPALELLETWWVGFTTGARLYLLCLDEPPRFVNDNVRKLQNCVFNTRLTPINYVLIKKNQQIKLNVINFDYPFLKFWWYWGRFIAFGLPHIKRGIGFSTQSSQWAVDKPRKLAEI
jgi:hypothetical protein